MKWILILAMAVLAVALMAVPSHAVVVFEKPLDATEGPGWYSNSGGQQIADDFSLAAGAEVTDVAWYGFFVDSLGVGTGQTVADFDILFFNDDGSGLPQTADFYSATVSGVAGVDTGLTEAFFGRTIYGWETSIPTALLPAGNLWISIRASATESDFFSWANSDTGGVISRIARFADTDAWARYFAPTRNEQAFRLESVPEPATMLLLGFGLIGIGAARRKLR